MQKTCLFEIKRLISIILISLFLFIDFSFAHLSLSKSIAITTGNKLKVSGAQVLGESLKVRAKELEISSRQDTANYKSKQKNIGGSLTVGTAGVSGSVNFGRSKVNSDYAAVKTQSGLFAGDGGYDVEVTNHTRLNGGIITSSKKAEAERKNRFSTGTLSTKDIANRSDYKGEGFSVDLGFSVNTDSKTKETTFSPSQPVVGVGSDSGNARSVTKAGINTANITITNKEAQSELNDAAGKDIVASVKTDRDSESVLADTGLANLFNAAEVEGNIASQIEAMKSLSRSSQKVKGIIERKEKELEKIKDKLSKEEYNRRKKTYENGRLLLNSLTNALGTPSNGVAGMAAQGISPYLANQIGEYFADQDKKGSLGHGLAHAVLGAAVAAVGGNDALTAGLTAGSAEVIAPLLSRFMYGTDNPENLTASQKKTLVSIASLAGLAVGSTTGNVNDLAATNTAAVNAIENNYLTKKDVKNYIREVRDCIQGGGSNESCRKKLDKKYELISQKRNETLTKELEACNKDIKCIGDLNQQVTELSANDINVIFGGFVNADKENLLVSLQKEGKLKILSEVNSLREAFKQSSCSGYGSRVCAQKFDEEILQKHGITKEHLEIFDWAKRFKGKGLDSLDVLVEEGEISPAAAAALYTLITILPDSELDAVFAGLGGVGTAAANLGRVARGVNSSSRFKGVNISDKKFDYFFGRVNSSPGNTQRSLQNKQQLESIGIYDTPKGRKIIRDTVANSIIDESSVVKSYNKIVNGTIYKLEEREMLIQGPAGIRHLIAGFEVLPSKERVLTTIILKGGPKK